MSSSSIAELEQLKGRLEEFAMIGKRQWGSNDGTLLPQVPGRGVTAYSSNIPSMKHAGKSDGYSNSTQSKSQHQQNSNTLDAVVRKMESILDNMPTKQLADMEVEVAVSFVSDMYGADIGKLHAELIEGILSKGNADEVSEAFITLPEDFWERREIRIGGIFSKWIRDLTDPTIWNLDSASRGETGKSNSPWVFNREFSDALNEMSADDKRDAEIGLQGCAAAARTWGPACRTPANRLALQHYYATLKFTNASQALQMTRLTHPLWRHYYASINPDIDGSPLGIVEGINDSVTLLRIEEIGGSASEETLMTLALEYDMSLNALNDVLLSLKTLVRVANGTFHNCGVRSLFSLASEIGITGKTEEIVVDRLIVLLDSFNISGLRRTDFIARESKISHQEGETIVESLEEFKTYNITQHYGSYMENAVVSTEADLFQRAVERICNMYDQKLAVSLENGEVEGFQFIRYSKITSDTKLFGVSSIIANVVALSLVNSLGIPDGGDDDNTDADSVLSIIGGRYTASRTTGNKLSVGKVQNPEGVSAVLVSEIQKLQVNVANLLLTGAPPHGGTVTDSTEGYFQAMNRYLYGEEDDFLDLDYLLLYQLSIDIFTADSLANGRSFDAFIHHKLLDQGGYPIVAGLTKILGNFATRLKGVYGAKSFLYDLSKDKYRTSEREQGAYLFELSSADRLEVQLTDTLVNLLSHEFYERFLKSTEASRYMKTLRGAWETLNRAQVGTSAKLTAAGKLLDVRKEVMLGFGEYLKKGSGSTISNDRLDWCINTLEYICKPASGVTITATTTAVPPPPLHNGDEQTNDGWFNYKIAVAAYSTWPIIAAIGTAFVTGVVTNVVGNSISTAVYGGFSMLGLGTSSGEEEGTEGQSSCSANELSKGLIEYDGIRISKEKGTGYMLPRENTTECVFKDGINGGWECTGSFIHRNVKYIESMNKCIEPLLRQYNRSDITGPGLKLLNSIEDRAKSFNHTKSNVYNNKAPETLSRAFMEQYNLLEEMTGPNGLTKEYLVSRTAVFEDYQGYKTYFENTPKPAFTGDQTANMHAKVFSSFRPFPEHRIGEVGSSTLNPNVYWRCLDPVTTANLKVPSVSTASTRRRDAYKAKSELRNLGHKANAMFYLAGASSFVSVPTRFLKELVGAWAAPKVGKFLANRITMSTEQAKSTVGALTRTVVNNDTISKALAAVSSLTLDLPSKLVAPFFESTMSCIRLQSMVSLLDVSYRIVNTMDTTQTLAPYLIPTVITLGTLVMLGKAFNYGRDIDIAAARKYNAACKRTNICSSIVSACLNKVSKFAAVKYSNYVLRYVVSFDSIAVLSGINAITRMLDLSLTIGTAGLQGISGMSVLALVCEVFSLITLKVRSNMLEMDRELAELIVIPEGNYSGVLFDFKRLKVLAEQQSVRKRHAGVLDGFDLTEWLTEGVRRTTVRELLENMSEHIPVIEGDERDDMGRTFAEDVQSIRRGLKIVINIAEMLTFVCGLVSATTTISAQANMTLGSSPQELDAFSKILSKSSVETSRLIATPYVLPGLNLESFRLHGFEQAVWSTLSENARAAMGILYAGKAPITASSNTITLTDYMDALRALHWWCMVPVAIGTIHGGYKVGSGVWGVVQRSGEIMKESVSAWEVINRETLQLGKEGVFQKRLVGL